MNVQNKQDNNEKSIQGKYNALNIQVREKIGLVESNCLAKSKGQFCNLLPWIFFKRYNNLHQIQLSQLLCVAEVFVVTTQLQSWIKRGATVLQSVINHRSIYTNLRSSVILSIVAILLSCQRVSCVLLLSFSQLLFQIWIRN